MGWLRKARDPVSDRARALSDEIARLESQIKKLDSKLRRDDTPSRPRSTPLPHSAPPSRADSPPAAVVPPPPAPAPSEPIFERVDQHRLTARAETEDTPEHFNDLGVRKYDLPALFRRLRNQFRGPSTTNPKLVSYLAAGGLQGLRPLRYEKRVARNRFIVLVIVLFLTLLGILLAVGKWK